MYEEPKVLEPQQWPSQAETVALRLSHQGRLKMWILIGTCKAILENCEIEEK